MARVVQGGVVTLSAVTGHADGSPVDAPDITLTILDPSGDALAGFPVAIPPIVHGGTGEYSYAWSVSATATLGDYEATWSATVDGVTATGSDVVEVAAPGTVSAVGYCTLTDVKARISGDLPNMGTEYDVVLAAKCIEATRDIDRMVAQARGVRGAWSFVADAAPSARAFTGKVGGVRYLPIDDAVTVTAVVVDGRTLTAGTDYVTDPLQGTPIVGLRMLAGVWSTIPGAVTVTARWGYGTEVPADVREAACIETIRSWRADQAGNSDVVGVTPFGTAQTTKAYSSKLARLVSDYSSGSGFLR